MNKLICLLIPVCFLLGCKKEKICPAFRASDIIYSPYSEYDTLLFINENNETYNIFIQNIELSESYAEEYKTVFNIKTVPCINNASVFATDTENDNPYTFLKIEQSDVSEMQYYKYQLKDFYFEIDFRNELPHIQEIDYLDIIPSLNVSGESYKNVVKLTDIENSSNEIKCVFLKKQKGIIQFNEDISNIEWMIINP